MTAAALPTDDVNALLHELRGREIARIPVNGSVVLSGGCPDRSYFDWFSSRYRGTVTEHIAIELFRDEPPDLPSEVRYVRGSLCDLGPIDDASVDLIFAGQVIEHLPREDLLGFLVAARRVLRPTGRLVLDSPNRDITLALGWHHPEHILELTPGEARELLELAGFTVDSLRGLWLSIDPHDGSLLPLEAEGAPDGWDPATRAREALARPDQSFIWWAEAVPADAPPDVAALTTRVGELFATHRNDYFRRLVHPMTGRRVARSDESFVVSERHQAGFLLVGPYIGVPPGDFTATFTFVPYRPEVLARLDPDAVAARVEITTGEERQTLTEHEIRVLDLPRTGESTEITLALHGSSTLFGCETRILATGAAPVAIRGAVTVGEPGAESPGVRRRPAPGDPIAPPPLHVALRSRVRATRFGDLVARVRSRLRSRRA